MQRETRILYRERNLQMFKRFIQLKWDDPNYLHQQHSKTEMLWPIRNGWLSFFLFIKQEIFYYYYLDGRLLAHQFSITFGCLWASLNNVSK